MMSHSRCVTLCFVSNFVGILWGNTFYPHVTDTIYVNLLPVTAGEPPDFAPAAEKSSEAKADGCDSFAAMHRCVPH